MAQKKAFILQIKDKSKKKEAWGKVVGKREEMKLQPHEDYFNIKSQLFKALAKALSQSLLPTQTEEDQRKQRGLSFLIGPKDERVVSAQIHDDVVRQLLDRASVPFINRDRMQDKPDFMTGHEMRALFAVRKFWTFLDNV